MKKIPEWIVVSMRYAKDVEKDEQLLELIACRKKYVAQISRRSWKKIDEQMRFIKWKLQLSNKIRMNPCQNSPWNERNFAILSEQWEQLIEARLKKFDREMIQKLKRKHWLPIMDSEICHNPLTNRD